ncbi:MarR family winged helix-turn-helix transcriptional regulator [Methylosinus trichosporium]|nr:MarR family transcriptional regulator [Methylosinus trichosporium]
MKLMNDRSRHAQLIMDSLRRIVQELRRSTSRCEQITGLTGAQVFVLRQIQSKNGLSLNELAALTFTHQSTMSEVICRLERKGLVLRSKSRDDARRLEIHLSAKGETVLASGYLTAQENLTRAIASLPHETVIHLAEGLDQLIRMADLSDQRPVLFFDDDRSGSPPGERPK